MSAKTEPKKQDQFNTKYVEPKMFVDRANFLNIKIPREAVQDLEPGDQIVVRKHINYILKMLGLPFESKKQTGERCLFDH